MQNFDIFKEVMMGLAGLGLFLVSIKLMSTSLRQMTGNKIGKAMKLIKKNPLIGCGVGIIFTTMIQSSDGAVALAIGLIAAGFLDLKTAIAFILGANIGTATTSIIVASSNIDAFKYIKYSLFSISFLGSMGLMILSGEKKTRIAMLLFSIGAIFVGLQVMSDGFGELANKAKSIIEKISNPFIAMIVSFILTGLFQSSSAVITIVQSFYAGKGIEIDAALGMIIGANIGTTFTAIIASFSSKKRDTKRIAVIWLFTNLTTAVLLMPLIATGLFGKLIQHINPPHNNFDLAIGHIFFNLILVIIFLPFTKQLAWLSNKIIKNKSSNEFPIMLPKQLLEESPELALEAAKKATYSMGQMAYAAEEELSLYLKTADKKHLVKFEEIHELLEDVRVNLSGYLIELGSKDISKQMSNKHMSLVLSSRSLDTITRLGFDFGTLIKSNFDKKTHSFKIDEESIAELRNLITILKSMTKRSYKQVKNYYSKRSNEVKELQILFEEKSEEFIKNNINRNKKNNSKNHFDFEEAAKILIRISHHANRVNKYQRKSLKAPKKIKLSPSLTKELLKK